MILDDALVEELELTIQLDKILDRETQGTIVRSGIRWAEEGGKSSTYFCKLEKKIERRKAFLELGMIMMILSQTG